MKKRYTLEDYEEQVRVLTESIVKRGFALKKATLDDGIVLDR